jgi:putative component of membrane protein insertase Oxa1/YidC/SpoIIIJ protein YidD
LAITPLAWLALRAIRLYQRHLSPRKGYCCALHAAGGGRSCSAYGYRAIARGGLVQGLALLRRRLHKCARVYAMRTVSGPSLRLRPRLAQQRGFCDAGCDVGDCSGGGSDALECVSEACDCDWPRGRRKEARPESNLDDYLNNENALRERIRQAQERARRDG